MPDSGYLFIHPWLNLEERWAGFLVEFIGNQGCLGQALSHLSQYPSLSLQDARLPWFIPIANEADAIAVASFQGEKVALLSSSLAVCGEENLNNLKASLCSSATKTALLLDTPEFLPNVTKWDYLVLTANQARCLSENSLTELSARSAIAVTGLHSRSDLAWANAHYCSLVTGEYLLTPSSPGGKPDMVRLRLLKLIGLIAQDADTSELEHEFRQEPKLAYSLLRLANSAAVSPLHSVTTFTQAIMTLGRRQLQRWLQLLVYADPNNGQAVNPLLLKAAARGHLMETLVPRIQPLLEVDIHPDTVFMTGVFSLLDVLLNLPMPEILQQFSLPTVVRAALEGHQGPLGWLVMALSAADRRDMALASRLLDNLGIDCETFLDAQLTALGWAGSLLPSSQ